MDEIIQNLIIYLGEAISRACDKLDMWREEQRAPGVQPGCWTGCSCIPGGRRWCGKQKRGLILDGATVKVLETAKQPRPPGPVQQGLGPRGRGRHRGDGLSPDSTEAREDAA